MKILYSVILLFIVKTNSIRSSFSRDECSLIGGYWTGTNWDNKGKWKISFKDRGEVYLNISLDIPLCNSEHQGYYYRDSEFLVIQLQQMNFTSCFLEKNFKGKIYFDGCDRFLFDLFVPFEFNRHETFQDKVVANLTVFIFYGFVLLYLFMYCTLVAIPDLYRKIRNDN